MTETLTAFALGTFAQAASSPMPNNELKITLEEDVRQQKPARVSSGGADEVVTLDSANFEKLTQAATGATTGNWFVDFYAPWW